jgi:hypothetical protein
MAPILMGSLAAAGFAAGLAAGLAWAITSETAMRLTIRIKKVETASLFIALLLLLF